jgi:hypothetical protein
MTRRSGPHSVGLCLGDRGAVVAVVGADPRRLAAIADISWPAGLWRAGRRTDPTVAAAARTLSRARHRLGLARWHPVSLVLGPSLPDGAAALVLPASAQVLARAGLVPSWVTPAASAAELARTARLAVDPRLQPAMAGPDAVLAIGTALARLPAAEQGAPDGDEPVPEGRWAGWAVQQIDGATNRQ